jgi:hypothetical protein
MMSQVVVYDHFLLKVWSFGRLKIVYVIIDMSPTIRIHQKPCIL